MLLNPAPPRSLLAPPLLQGLYRGHRVARERHRERRAAARPARHFDTPPVCLRDPLTNGEAQPRAGSLPGPGARRVGPPEAVENVRQVAEGDPDPRVRDAEGHPAVLLPELHAD